MIQLIMKHQDKNCVYNRQDQFTKIQIVFYNLIKQEHTIPTQHHTRQLKCAALISDPEE